MYHRIGCIGGLVLATIVGTCAEPGQGAAPASQPAATAMPDMTPPGKPHFDKMGAQVGEQLPALPVYTPDGKETSLDRAWQGRPTLLLTSSYTCPKSRSTYPSAAVLAYKLKDKVNVAVIYVIEAHPAGDPSPYSGVEDITNENRRDNVLCPQPRTLKDRLELAKRFQKRLEVGVPIFVDAMDNAVWKSLGGGPNMGVLVDEKGIVLARQGWFDAASMKTAADAIFKALPVRREEVNAAEGFDDYKDAQPTIDGNLELVKAQIAKNPALVTKVFPYMARGGEGDMTLLHYATGYQYSKGRHLEIVEFLVSKGADVNKQTEHVPSPLHLAAAKGDLAIAQFLIAHGADVNARAQGRGPTPLQEALIHNNAAVAGLLEKSGAKTNFFTDVASGKLDQMKAAIIEDPSIVNRADGWNRPPLTYAAAVGQMEVAKILLDAGARDLSPKPYGYSDDRSAIVWAVRTKNVQMVRLLCENGSDCNLLDDAIFEDATDVARELLMHKADPNRADIRGYRPLHYAGMLNRPAIARILLDGGADPNAKTGPNLAPCAPVFGGDEDVDFPLNVAAAKGSAEVVALLIQHGGKLDALNGRGYTPLISATSSFLPSAKVLAAVMVLVEAKADLNAKTRDGLSPLDCAIIANRKAETPDTAVIDYLRSHGGK